MSSAWRIAAPVIGGVLILDQLTKILAERLLPLHQEWALLPFLSLRRMHNAGASFGFLHDAGGWQRWFLIALSGAIMLWLALWMRRLRPDERHHAWPLALILGGAAGNLIDRLAHGTVVDFIALHYQHWYWPTFNFADAAITLGVVGLLLAMRRSHRA